MASPRCSAHRSNGDPCKAYSVRGATVCVTHGGAAPRVKAAAARRVSEARAVEAVRVDADAVLAYRATKPTENPLDGLARLASEVTAFKDALAARVNALTEIRYGDVKGSEQLRAEVALYERALDRTARLLETMVKLDFEKRMVALNEAQFEIVGRAIDLILDEMDLTPEQQSRVPEIVPRAFEVLEGGKAAA